MLYCYQFGGPTMKTQRPQYANGDGQIPAMTSGSSRVWAHSSQGLSSLRGAEVGSVAACEGANRARESVGKLTKPWRGRTRSAELRDLVRPPRAPPRAGQALQCGRRAGDPAGPRRGVRSLRKPVPAASGGRGRDYREPSAGPGCRESRMVKPPSYSRPHCTCSGSGMLHNP